MVYVQTPNGEVYQTESPENWKDSKRISKAEYERQHSAYCIRKLRKWLKPGATVHTILKHVSSSGMTRHIECVIPQRNGEILNITYFVAGVTGWRLAHNGGLIVGGCGMDMGFHTVYTLGRYLYPKGFKLPKNKKYGRNGDTSGFDKDGGYALNQRWI